MFCLCKGRLKITKYIIRSYNCYAWFRTFDIMNPTPKYGELLTCGFFFIYHFVNTKMYCFLSRLYRLVPVVPSHNNLSQTPNCRASHRISVLNKSRPKYEIRWVFNLQIFFYQVFCQHQNTLFLITFMQVGSGRVKPQ